MNKANKPNNFLEKGFYIEDQILSSNTKIHTEEQFRMALLFHAEKKQVMEYEGWDPDDYTRQNIQEFQQKWTEKQRRLKEGTFCDLVQYVITERINLSLVKPSELTQVDFEDDNSPKFLEIANIIPPKEKMQ